MTTGEGGMITTNNKELYEKMKYLRDHAMSKEKRYWHTEIGYNYRMTNLQAALGLAQLERIDELIEKRIKIFNWYYERLRNIKGIKLNYTAPWAKNVYWMVCLEVEGYDEDKRNNLMRKLRKEGIDTRPYFYPISDLPMYEDERVNTPVTHKVYKRGMNLPTYFDLTEEQVEYICNKILGMLL